MTGCVCPMAGYCTRHSMNKNVHFHHLCQNSEKYFNLWEGCRGPGQEFTDCAKASVKREEVLPDVKPPCTACAKAQQEQLKQNLPSLTEQAGTLASASLAHAKNGFKNTTDDMKKNRLEICDNCEFFIRDHKRCGKCGCFVEVKAKWESNHCPVGKW